MILTFYYHLNSQKLIWFSTAELSYMLAEFVGSFFSMCAGIFPQIVDFLCCMRLCSVSPVDNTSACG